VSTTTGKTEEKLQVRRHLFRVWRRSVEARRKGGESFEKGHDAAFLKLQSGEKEFGEYPLRVKAEVHAGQTTPNLLLKETLY